MVEGRQGVWFSLLPSSFTRVGRNRSRLPKANYTFAYTFQKNTDKKSLKTMIRRVVGGRVGAPFFIEIAVLSWC
jgi:hypothetical protein